MDHDYPSILGIDLGITRASMAVLDEDGTMRTLPNAEGEDTTPTVLHIFDEDEIIVGREAQRMIALDPDHVITDVPLKLGEAGWTFTAFDQTWTAQELVARLFQKLRSDANDVRGTEYTCALISVPSWFDSARRQAVLEAAEIAGLQVKSMVNQPTASALGAKVYQFDHNGSILLIDIGGRDTELSIIERAASGIRLDANTKRFDLCVAAFEARIQRWLMEQAATAAQGTLPHEPRLAQQIRDASYNLLDALHTRPSAPTRLAVGSLEVQATLDRPTLARLSSNLLDHLIAFINEWLQSPAIADKQLTDVLLVGRGARIPQVRDRLRARFRDIFCEIPDPTLVQARGAALLGAIRHAPAHPGLRAMLATPTKPKSPLSSSTTLPPGSLRTPSGIHRASFGLADGGVLGGSSFSVTDTTTQTLGLIALDRQRRERVVPIIREGTRLPCEVRGRFTYAYAGMTAVRVEVTEGVGKHREEVRVIGVVELHDLPPRPIGTPIEIVYTYGFDQILLVDVIDIETNMRKHVDIAFRGALTSSQMAAATQRAGLSS